MAAEWERRLAEERAGWASTQAAAVGVLQRIAAPPVPSVAGAASELLGGSDVPLVDGRFRVMLLAAEDCEAAEYAALAPRLRELTNEHEVQLEHMYGALRAGRDAARVAGVMAASERGPQGLMCSVADHCAAAAAAVAAHELELQLKEGALAEIERGADELVLQTLLAMWSSQPMLAEARAVEAGMAEQRTLERALGSGR
jgi:hypothetical protein